VDMKDKDEMEAFI